MTYHACTVRGRHMTTSRQFLLAAGVFILLTGLPGAAAQGPQREQPAQASDPPARPDLVRQPYSTADVEFMAGMIPHHAQAVLIAGWAPSHGARPEVRVLCERMVVAQRDEIDLMRNWLRDRGEAVPNADATHHRMKMNGVEHDMLMPGMLSPDELKQLDKARNAEWDRLFLTFMIRHHEGAIKMVDDLFNAYGALQDEDMYKFASDLYADQTTEIDRMHQMLAETDKRGK
jgi:uncharacterized protein (DUF305 family)